MINYCLGHKFIERKSNSYDEYYICIECGILCLPGHCLPGHYYSTLKFYYINDFDEIVELDITCDEFIIKNILE